MKIYEYSLGAERHLAVAQNDDDAYERRAEVNEVFAFTPVQISEVQLPGYDITLKKKKEG